MSKSIQYYQDRLGSLRTERESFIPHWKDLSEHFMPRQSRFFMQDRNRGEKRNQKIYNERGSLALRTLASGMMTGISNPARAWIALRTPDPDLNEYKPVKLFLEATRDRMLQIFLRSNLYTTLPLGYKDQACYGTTAYLALEDPESLLRCYHYPMGSYMLATDHRNKMDTCYREFSMTARQMVGQFGKSNCSIGVQKTADQAAGKETWLPVVHAIEPNEDYNPSRQQFQKYKKFYSCYFEAGGDADKKLRESGFDRFPVIAPRWGVTGEDVYGSDCPGMDALGSVRQLQLREKRKGQLIDKGVAPPMNAPASLKNSRHSILSGDVTYVSDNPVAQKFEPTYLPPPQYYQWVLQDIDSLENRISRTFFEDLFLMLVNDQRSNITAREIAELHEEKLFQLGPVLLRQNDEGYDPLVDINFDFMARNRILPQIPPELRNMDLGVEYISILSQAMKLVGVSSMERAVGFAGNLIPIWPEVRHMINPFNTVTEYFNIVGASPKLLNDKRAVDAAIKQEAAKQQAMQMMAAIQPAADTMKTLADTKLDEGENALGRISQAMTGAAA